MKIRQLHTKGLCNVALIDYLQKMRLYRKDGQNEASAIGDQVEGIKTTCEMLNIPAVLASQINREAGLHRQRKTAHGIRGSGEVGEKANVVITLDRPVLDKDQNDSFGRLVALAGQRTPEIIGRVDKNTIGSTGDFRLMMKPSRFQIHDAAWEDEPPGEEYAF